MKKNTTLLTALAICMASAVWGANAFTVNVMVGSASGNPSLVFGQGTKAEQKAFPPFSAMFGVKDVYLANSENFGAEAKVSGDFSRLGTDIRTVNDDNKWVLTASTDATAYFQFAEGDATLYVAEEGAVEGKPLSGSLSLKAGNSYTISTRSATRAVVPAEDPADKTVYLEMDEDSGLYEGETMVEDLNKATEVTMFFVSGDAPIYLFNCEKYFDKNGNSFTEEPTDGWIITLGARKIAYAGDMAIATFDEAMDEIALGGSAPKAYTAITTSVIVGGKKITSIHWNIKSSGTLDFDGDGEITLDDANYFYNYAAGDCSEYLEASDLLMFGTKAATVEKAQTALDYFRNNFASLFFDGSDADLANVLDNANYFYNFAAGDFSEYLEAGDLLMFGTKDATEEKAQTALEAMRQLMQ